MQTGEERYDWIERIVHRHQNNVKVAEKDLSDAKNSLSLAKEKHRIVHRVIRNIKSLKELTDAQLRRHNLPKIIASDRSRVLLELLAEGRKGCAIHYDISERFDGLRSWLVKKHDDVYDVENLGEMGSMSARHLKEGHDASEFDDDVWGVLDKWASSYCERKMNEELYHSIMNDSFAELYDKLTTSEPKES